MTEARDRIESDPSRPRVVAVVTSFRPASEIVSNVARIVAQVDSVVVVDDGSGPESDEVLGRVEAAGAAIIRHDKNRGIAAALNSGCEAAMLADGDFVVTFDHDSAIPDGFIDALIGTWDRARDAGHRVGLVTPALFAGLRQTTGSVSDGLQRSHQPIQSGSLLSCEVLRDVGPFREDLFIDLVDTEYFYRIRRAGWTAFAVPDLDLPHQLGRSYPIRLGGRVVRFRGSALSTSLSTPFRYYYRARNRVVINREYRAIFPAAIRRDTLLELRHLIFVLWFAKPRRQMIRVLRLGLRAGRERRMGPIPTPIGQLASLITWRSRPLD